MDGVGCTVQGMQRHAAQRGEIVMRFAEQFEDCSGMPVSGTEVGNRISRTRFNCVSGIPCSGDRSVTGCAEHQLLQRHPLQWEEWSGVTAKDQAGDRQARQRLEGLP